jgi:ligand-binding SRPBCC domain-containing protein
VLTSEQWVPIPLVPCFAFFADAANLEAITPPFLRFEIETPVPVVMENGTRIAYRLRLGGVPMRWVSRIEDWRPGEGFTDVQIEGPYARWVHRHRFVAGGGGTWVHDEVRYALPLAPWSDPIHAWFVRPRLRDIFAYRGRAIASALGGITTARRRSGRRWKAAARPAAAGRR